MKNKNDWLQTKQASQELQRMQVRHARHLP